MGREGPGDKVDSKILRVFETGSALATIKKFF